MDRFKSLKKIQVGSDETLDDDANGEEDDASQTLEKEVAQQEVKEKEEGNGGGEGDGEGEDGEGSEDVQPLVRMKVRRRASIYKECSDGDYIGVQSDPFLMKILNKQGDKTVLFADTVLKFTGSGKMKRRILLITDFAIYFFDSDADALKRRIALAAVDKLCASELSDNFFAIIIPTEYDCLIASKRKKEIVTILVEATTSSSGYELEVVVSNRFEYNSGADTVKEVEFEEVNGGIKTRIRKKETQSQE